MALLPSALERVIEELGHLPGVGPRTAERYAYFLLKNDSRATEALANALRQLHAQVKSCPKTFALIDADQEISPLYSDPKRDRQLVAVVEEPLDIVALERTGQFHGTYHVLGGTISPIDGDCATIMLRKSLLLPTLASRANQRRYSSSAKSRNRT